MTISTFLDWVEIAGHNANNLAASFALGPVPTDMFNRYLLYLAGDEKALKRKKKPERRLTRDADWMLGRDDLAMLDRLAAREQGVRIGVAIDTSGLITVSVHAPQELAEGDERRQTVAAEARMAALLVVNVLSQCLSGKDRFVPNGKSSKNKMIVVPTTVLWPVEVNHKHSRAENTPELYTARAAMKAALAGSLVTAEISRAAPGWTPADQHVRPALDAVAQRSVTIVERHIQRLNGKLREQAEERFESIVVHPTEKLLEQLFRQVTWVAFSLAALWFGLMLATWGFEDSKWFSMSVDELWFWSLCLCVATSALLLASYRTDGDKEQLGFLFRSRIRLWTPLVVLVVIAAAMIFVESWSTLGFWLNTLFRFLAEPPEIPIVGSVRYPIAPGVGTVIFLVSPVLEAIFGQLTSGETPEEGGEYAGNYKKVLKSLIWVMPVPLLVTLFQARATFGEIIKSQSKIQRQLAVVARLQSVTHDGQIAAKHLDRISALARANGDEEAAKPNSKPLEEAFKDLSERLKRAVERFKARQEEAQRRFRANSGITAFMALVALILQNSATFEPSDERSGTPFLLKQVGLATKQSGDGCDIDLPSLAARHASTLDAAFLTRIFLCLDEAEKNASVRAVAVADAMAAFEARLGDVEVAVQQPPRGGHVHTVLQPVCYGPRAQLCQIGDAHVPDLTTVADDAERLAAALAQAKIDMAVLGSRVPNSALTGASIKMGDIAERLAAISTALGEMSDLELTANLDIEPAEEQVKALKAALSDVPSIEVGVTLVGAERFVLKHVLDTCDYYGEHRFATAKTLVPADGSDGTGWYFENEKKLQSEIHQSVLAGEDLGRRFYVFGSADPKGPLNVNELTSEQRAIRVADLLATSLKDGDSVVTARPEGRPRAVAFALGENAWMLGAGLPQGEDDPALRVAWIYGCDPAETKLAANGGDQ